MNYPSPASIIDQAYSQGHVYPDKSQVLSALELTPFDRVRVVILGQDPYHGPGQAMGLSFSVPDGVDMPPSLKNIYAEVQRDLGRPATPASLNTGNLTSWATQGVLLLNSVLTVQSGQPASHSSLGWQEYTDSIISQISSRRKNVVFLLWGKYAQSKTRLIDVSKHLVLQSSHPSPLSVYRGFDGCAHFSQTNTYLTKHNNDGINW